MLFMLLLVTGITVIVSLLWRRTDRRANEALWASLARHQPANPVTFDPAMVADLPEPARRYFRFAIKPGTPLYTVAEIAMSGDFSLGDRANPRYFSMQANEILAAPHGFVWRVRAARGLVHVSGADAAADNVSWSRFWLLGMVPVARAGGNSDHLRSAFGRCAAEAVFWTPAALLPARNVRWEAVDSSTARVTLVHGGLSQTVDISLAADGRPVKVVFSRWSNANSRKVFQLQPFGGYVYDFKEFGG